MYITHYNDCATRGVFELDNHNLYKLFPNTNSALIDYLVYRDYRNIKDTRFSVCYAGSPLAEGIEYYKFSLTAKSSVRADDVYDEKAGTALIRRKLHAKAKKFANDMNQSIDKQIDQMIQAIETARLIPLPPMKDMIDPSKDHSTEADCFYSIKDTTSVVRYNICFDGDDNKVSISKVIDSLAMQLYMCLIQRKRVGYAEREVISEFLTWFRQEMAWQVPLSTTIRAKVIRHESDTHDPKMAAYKLYDKLRCSWSRLNRRIRKQAIKILAKQKEVPEWTRWNQAIKMNDQRCADLNLN